MFQNRLEAGKVLARELKEYKNVPGVVLAVPRGGIPVGYVVAKELNLPLDLVLTKKIGHPFSKEYAIGAVSLTDSFIVPHPDVSPDYIDEETNAVREKLKAMSRKFLGDKKHEVLKDKTVIVVDDGIATGSTLLATINILRKQNPKKIVIAVPVAPDSAIQKLKKVADEVISVMIPEEFYGVGAFYENFHQVTDDEVLFYLNKLSEERSK